MPLSRGAVGVEAGDHAAEGEAQVGTVVALGVAPAVDADQGLRLEVVGGFLEALADHSVHQGFALVQMAGGLVEENAVVGPFLHQQVLAVLFDDGRDDDVGFPVITHDMALVGSGGAIRPSPESRCRWR
jgi:hypothetical protein